MMKSQTLSLCLALLMGLAMSAQSVSLIVYGNIANTGGQIVPVTISTSPGTTPAYSNVVNADANGVFLDSLQVNSNPASIDISFTDCNGNAVTSNYIGQFNPGGGGFGIFVNEDFCPGAAIDCLGVSGGTALPGTPCLTALGITGTWDPNCLCQPSTGSVDCLGNPGGTALPGTACVDSLGNSGTWDPNCICQTGQALDCLGVPGGSALPGTACNDNNPLTGLDIYLPNCICQGQIIDCLGVPGGANLPGTSCVDSSGVIGAWDSNCNCATGGSTGGYGIIFVQLTNTNGVAVPLTITTCDSITQPAFTSTVLSNPNGIYFDTLLFTSASACVSITFVDCSGSVVTQQVTNQLTAFGTFPDFNFLVDYCPNSTIDCLGNPGGSALPGTACVDSSGVSGIWDPNCVCQTGQGTIDCLGVPGGNAQPGTACVDSLGNNGIWNPNCVCITNTLADCLGVVGGTALPGTPCNDGDPNTLNDTWDLGCNCIGFLPMPDCNGVVGGPDIPGAPCNDNDSLTFFDHWDWNCNCTGVPLNPGSCNAQFFAFQSIDSTGTVVPNTLNVIALFALPSIGNGLSFFWDFGDGNSSTDPFPMHTYAGNGPYNLCVTISDSTCTDTYCDSISVDTSGVIIRGQSGFTINISPAQATAVDEIEDSNIDFSMFPNPAMDAVTLSIFDELSGKTDVAIYDVSGKIVLTKSFNASLDTKLDLNIRKLEDGVYFLRLGSGTKQTTKRLVKTTR